MALLPLDRSKPESRERTFDGLLYDDLYHEGDETLCVKFDRPRSLRLPGGVDEYFATITLTDDDPAPTIAIDAPRAAEGAGTLDFTVTLTNPPEHRDVTLRYRDNGTGSATSGADYEALANGTAAPDAVGEGAAATGITVTATVNGATRFKDTTTVTVSVGGGSAISGTDYGADAPEHGLGVEWGTAGKRVFNWRMTASRRTRGAGDRDRRQGRAAPAVGGRIRARPVPGAHRVDCGDTGPAGMPVFRGSPRPARPQALDSIDVSASFREFSRDSA